MRQSHIVAATIFAALATGTVSAQTTPEAQSKPAAAQPAPALSSKPYSRLFGQQLPYVSATRRRIDARSRGPMSLARQCPCATSAAS